MNSIRQIARNRPFASMTLASATGLVSGAALVEYVANKAEEEHKRNPSVPALILPRTYDWDTLNSYWMRRPITTLRRMSHVLSELVPMATCYTKDFVIQTPDPDAVVELQTMYAAWLREALTNLGPAFVKAGQQLSIRPDLVPPPFLKELQKLCDAVRPVPDEVALRLLREELGVDPDTIFLDLQLVAAASLGQVYKANLKSGEAVAVKVQRPDMRKMFSLDLFLLQRVGVLVDLFTSLCTNQPPFHKPLYESFARGSYSELDYENEAENQIRFQKEFDSRRCPVVVPNVYRDYSTERVLTTQWIDGVKLADAPKQQIRKLIPVGVELFLTQLLDIGAFHADPHPGNLLVTKSGQLCLLDFGLCAEVDVKAKNALTKAIVHLLMRDFDALVAEDAKELGFLPEDFDTTELKPLLTKILTVGFVESGSNLRHRRKKLMEISNELNEVFFRYPFSVPPFFALVTRGLGLLEGIALSGDPNFDIFRASAPYARSHAVALLGRHTFSKSRRVSS